MMTAVHTEDVVLKVYEESSFSLLVVVTAGVGNAVDVAKSYQQNLTFPAWNNQHLGVCQWRIDRRGIYSMYYDCDRGEGKGITGFGE